MRTIKFNLAILSLLLAINFITSCKKDKTNRTTECKISDQQIEDLGSFDNAHALLAYETVVAKDSSILESGNFGCEVYEWLKKNPQAPARDVTRMNFEEKKLFILGILSLNPIDRHNVFVAMSAGAYAWDKSGEMYPCDEFTKSKRDAVRHALWNGLMSAYAFNNTAVKWSAAHESVPGNEPDEIAMDNHNNEVGRKIGEKFNSLKFYEMADYIASVPFVYIEKPSAGIPAQYAESFVFYAQKRPYDVDLSGTFTNPDSGIPEPFQVVFSLNQCDKVLRGRIAFTRQGGTAYVRINGETTAGGVRLFYATPNSYESTSCLNVNMVLNGTPESLSGNWTSTNCLQGGIINLSKMTSNKPFPALEGKSPSVPNKNSK